MVNPTVVVVMFRRMMLEHFQRQLGSPGRGEEHGHDRDLEVHDVVHDGRHKNFKSTGMRCADVRFVITHSRGYSKS